MKKGVICLVSMFPSWVMVLKLSKKKAVFTSLCWPQQEITKVFAIKEVKNTIPWTYVFNDLSGKEIIGTLWKRTKKKSLKI